jgi:ribose transport system permease protein
MSSLQETAGSLPAWRSRLAGRQATGGWAVYVSLVAIFLLFAITLSDRGFLTETNLLNILTQAGPIAIMAVASVFVLSTGEIDLSIGSVVALAALVTAVVLRDTGNLILGLGAGMGTGIAVGLINGLMVTKIRIPSFLATIAMMAIASGLSRTITDLEPVAIENATFNNVFGSGQVGSVSTVVVWAVVVVVLGYVFFALKRFGAHVRATGDNRGAAETAGINTDRIRLAALTISGAAAAFAAILDAGRLQGAQYTLGENDLLTVIAAVIIGGTSLFGGRGSIIGAAAGAVMLAMLNNGLILLGLSVSEQSIALGVIIILAVSFGLRERKA